MSDEMASQYHFPLQKKPELKIAEWDKGEQNIGMPLVATNLCLFQTVFD